MCKRVWPVNRAALQFKTHYFAEPGSVGDGKLITAMEGRAESETMTLFFKIPWAFCPHNLKFHSAKIPGYIKTTEVGENPGSADGTSASTRYLGMSHIVLLKLNTSSYFSSYVPRPRICSLQGFSPSIPVTVTVVSYSMSLLKCRGKRQFSYT